MMWFRYVLILFLSLGFSFPPLSSAEGLTLRRRKGKRVALRSTARSNRLRRRSKRRKYRQPSSLYKESPPADWGIKSNSRRGKIIRKMLNHANSYVGLKEATRNNDGRPSWRFSDGALEPWCANFVKTVMLEAGIRLPGHWRWMAGTHYMMMQLQQFLPVLRRRKGHRPRVGDLVFFEEPNARNFARHVAFAYRVTKTHVYVIEGNFSDKVSRTRYGYNLKTGLLDRSRQKRRVLGYVRWSRAINALSVSANVLNEWKGLRKKYMEYWEQRLQRWRKFAKSKRKVKKAFRARIDKHYVVYAKKRDRVWKKYAKRIDRARKFYNDKIRRLAERYESRSRKMARLFRLQTDARHCGKAKRRRLAMAYQRRRRSVRSKYLSKVREIQKRFWKLKQHQKKSFYKATEGPRKAYQSKYKKIAKVYNAKLGKLKKAYRTERRSVLQGQGQVSRRIALLQRQMKTAADNKRPAKRRWSVVTVRRSVWEGHKKRVLGWRYYGSRRKYRKVRRMMRKKRRSRRKRHRRKRRR